MRGVAFRDNLLGGPRRSWSTSCVSSIGIILVVTIIITTIIIVPIVVVVATVVVVSAIVITTTIVITTKIVVSPAIVVIVEIFIITPIVVPVVGPSPIAVPGCWYDVCLRLCSLRLNLPDGYGILVK